MTLLGILLFGRSLAYRIGPTLHDDGNGRLVRGGEDLLVVKPGGYLALGVVALADAIVVIAFLSGGAW